MDEQTKLRLIDSARGRVKDFAERVAPAYMAMRWQWREKGIPNTAAIQEGLNEKLDGLSEKDVTAVSSGGLRAEIKEADPVNEYGPRVVLSFGVSEVIDADGWWSE